MDQKSAKDPTVNEERFALLIYTNIHYINVKNVVKVFQFQNPTDSIYPSLILLSAKKEEGAITFHFILT